MLNPSEIPEFINGSFKKKCYEDVEFSRLKNTALQTFEDNFNSTNKGSFVSASCNSFLMHYKSIQWLKVTDSGTLPKQCPAKEGIVGHHKSQLTNCQSSTIAEDYTNNSLTNDEKINSDDMFNFTVRKMKLSAKEFENSQTHRAAPDDKHEHISKKMYENSAKSDRDKVVTKPKRQRHDRKNFKSSDDSHKKSFFNKEFSVRGPPADMHNSLTENQTSEFMMNTYANKWPTEHSEKSVRISGKNDNFLEQSDLFQLKLQDQELSSYIAGNVPYKMMIANDVHDDNEFGQSPSKASEKNLTTQSQVIQPVTKKNNIQVIAGNLTASVLTKDHILKSIIEKSKIAKSTSKNTNIFTADVYDKHRASMDVFYNSKAIITPNHQQLMDFYSPYNVGYKKIEEYDGIRRYQGKDPPKCNNILNKNFNNFYGKKPQKIRKLRGKAPSFHVIKNAERKLYEDGSELGGMHSLLSERAQSVVSGKTLHEADLERVLQPLDPLPQHVFNPILPENFKWAKKKTMQQQRTKTLQLGEDIDQNAEDNPLLLHVESFESSQLNNMWDPTPIKRDPKLDKTLSPIKIKPERGASRAGGFQVRKIKPLKNALQRKGTMRYMMNSCLQVEAPKNVNRDVHSQKSAFQSNKNYESHWIDCIDKALYNLDKMTLEKWGDDIGYYCLINSKPKSFSKADASDVSDDLAQVFSEHFLMYEHLRIDLDKCTEKLNIEIDKRNEKYGSPKKKETVDMTGGFNLKVFKRKATFNAELYLDDDEYSSMQQELILTASKQLEAERILEKKRKDEEKKAQDLEGICFNK